MEEIRQVAFVVRDKGKVIATGVTGVRSQDPTVIRELIAIRCADVKAISSSEVMTAEVEYWEEVALVPQGFILDPLVEVKAQPSAFTPEDTSWLKKMGVLV